MKLIRLILVLSLFMTQCTINKHSDVTDNTYNNEPRFELIYENVTGTYYNAVKGQTNSEPTITGSNKKIDINNASDLRWIAISQIMLDSEYRRNLIKNNPSDVRFSGKLQYGDTIWIESPYQEINGWWIANDAMNKRYIDRIDFLQTLGDTKLKRGLFKDIKIYKVKNAFYSQLNS